MVTAIIFGANGQDGFYLSNLLMKSGISVIPIGRFNSFNHCNQSGSNIDISNFSQVSELIEKNQPNYIFHFAANSTINHSALFENHATICTGTINILEAVKNVSPNTKVFISGSGLQFTNLGNPIKESDPFEARDPYSVSRIHSVYAARYYRRLGIKVYVGYFFNHDSPRRSERHISKKITEAVKRISNGSDEKLEIGDLNVVKEWTFAGDVVNAVWTLVQQDKVFEANIGSGLGYSIKQWVEVCFNVIDNDWRKYVISSESFKSDYACLISDPSIIHALDWTPEVNLTDLAYMMINSES
ncbi:MAG: GDP-mannose 4,6-dehydratase [bacterium]